MALFGTSKDSEQPMTKQVSTAAPNQVNIIAEGTVFEGTLQADCDVRVSGRIVGKLEVKGRAVVAPEGAIDGEVLATNATVAGTVQGDLVVTERLMLGSSARVDGTIKTGRLIVEEGAVFNGECQMGQPGQIRKKAALQEAAQPRRPDLPRDDRNDRSETTEGSDKTRAMAGEHASPKF